MAKIGPCQWVPVIVKLASCSEIVWADMIRTFLMIGLATLDSLMGLLKWVCFPAIDIWFSPSWWLNSVHRFTVLNHGTDSLYDTCLSNLWIYFEEILCWCTVWKDSLYDTCLCDILNHCIKLLHGFTTWILYLIRPFAIFRFTVWIHCTYSLYEICLSGLWIHCT